MKYFFRRVSLIILCVMMMAACGVINPVQTSEVTNTTDSTQSVLPYPPPVSSTRDPSYPPPQATSQVVNPAYPAPQQEPTMEVKAFKGEVVPFLITKPLKAGATEVKGTGPKGVPIEFSDITFQGEVLGSTVIGEDGSFTFTVPALQEQHRYGVKLADVNSPEWNINTFTDPRFLGPNYMLLPQDSFYYDTAMVEP